MGSLIKEKKLKLLFKITIMLTVQIEKLSSIMKREEALDKEILKMANILVFHNKQGNSQLDNHFKEVFQQKDWEILNLKIMKAMLLMKGKDLDLEDQMMKKEKQPETLVSTTKLINSWIKFIKKNILIEEDSKGLMAKNSKGWLQNNGRKGDN